MLQYPNIIQQLSNSDKIQLLCDIHSLADKKYRVLGIPAVTIASVEDYCGKDFPSPVALANAWDGATAESTAHHLFRKMADEGIDLAILPGPKPKTSPYRAALSEDPLLARAITDSYLRAAAQYGVSVALDNVCIEEDEIFWLDDQPDSRMVQELLVKPYVEAASAPSCKALIVTTETANEAYGTINAGLADTVNSRLPEGKCFRLCRSVSAQKIVEYLAGGGLCFQGPSLALESALERYLHLEKKVTLGTATSDELQQQLLLGQVLSPRMLDEATDRLLQFAFSVKRKPTVNTLSADPQAAEKALLASTVLLKNTRVLPLKKAASLCIIGDIALQEDNGAPLADELTATLTARGFTVTGAARGYDLARERSEELFAPAAELAEHSDFILLMLGLGKQREKLASKHSKIFIPANQQALLEQLAQQRKKIIAILPPEYCPDVVNSNHCAALMLCPLDNQHSAKILADVLSGAANPGGKLASTMHCNTEQMRLAHCSEKYRDHIQTGIFLGYRGYDTAALAPQFPFGHGLSYSDFTYSQLSISNGVAQFTVTNRSKLPGVEIAQVYVGKSDSAVLRPKKELAGFLRMELAPGERKTVQIPITIPPVYQTANNCFVEEKGKYTAYVGNSLVNTPLCQSFTAGTETLEPDGKHLSDYIRSESNILTNHFKLEAKYITMKKSVFHYIAGAVLLLLAIVLKLYCAYTRVESLFFNLFSIALAIVGVAFLVVEAVGHNLQESRERAAIDKKARDQFAEADAKTVTEYSAEQMFVQEFDRVEEQVNHTPENAIEGVDVDLLAYVDKDLTWQTAQEEFTVFANERGCRFPQETVRDLFASLATSRLLIVRNMESEQFRKFMLILTSYFETSTYIDRVDASYVRGENLLFKTDAQENRRKTNALLAMETAQNNKHQVHLAALDQVVPENLPLYFAPYLAYVKNPLASHQITAANEYGTETSYHLPQNLWFVLNLATGKTPNQLPGFVCEAAVVNQFPFDNCASQGQQTFVRKFSYHQLEFLAEKAVATQNIPEEQWRKLDRLEKFISSHTPFAIHNKTWLYLETYAYVSLACQGELTRAFDRAVCAKLMSQVIGAIQGKLTEEDRSLEENVDQLLGEEWCDSCKKLIRDCSAKRS